MVNGDLEPYFIWSDIQFDCNIKVHEYLKGHFFEKSSCLTCHKEKINSS